MAFILLPDLYENKKYNNLRRGYLILIASLINEHLISDDINDYYSKIIEIEQSCYDHSIETAEYELLYADFSNKSFEILYRTYITRITKNLDIHSEVNDDYLAGAILDGSIDLKTISKLSNKELSPDKNKKLFKAFDDRLNQKATLKTSSLYRCKKCGHKETTIRSSQLKSLDESETLIITCTFCSYKWFN